MTPGLYTELFFLDEATALAAGHRPCAECRRRDFMLFAELWNTSGGRDGRAYVAEMDAVLHRQRLASRRPAPGNQGAEAPLRLRLGDLPTGSFALIDGKAVLVGEKHRLLRWSFEGYRELQYVDTGQQFQVITPPSILKVLRAGYRPQIHPSACVRPFQMG